MIGGCCLHPHSVESFKAINQALPGFKSNCLHVVSRLVKDLNVHSAGRKRRGNLKYLVMIRRGHAVEMSERYQRGCRTREGNARALIHLHDIKGGVIVGKRHRTYEHQTDHDLEHGDSLVDFLPCFYSKGRQSAKPRGVLILQSQSEVRK